MGVDTARSATRYCIECGEALPPNARFCATCGTKVIAVPIPAQAAHESVPAPRAPGLTCPKCGEPKAEPRPGCSNCGHIDTVLLGIGSPATQRTPVRLSPGHSPPPPVTGSSGLPSWAIAILVLTVPLVLICGGFAVYAATRTPSVTSPPPGNKATAQYLDPRQLAANPKAYVGRNIYLQGQSNTVDQKGDYTWLQLMSQVRDRDYATESIVVELRPKNSNILKSECYRVYAVVKGTTRVKLLLTGAEQDVPLVSGYSIESAPRDQYGIGCANP